MTLIFIYVVLATYWSVEPSTSRRAWPSFTFFHPPCSTYFPRISTLFYIISVAIVFSRSYHFLLQIHLSNSIHILTWFWPSAVFISHLTCSMRSSFYLSIHFNVHTSDDLNLDLCASAPYCSVQLTKSSGARSYFIMFSIVQNWWILSLLDYLGMFPFISFGRK